MASIGINNVKYNNKTLVSNFALICLVRFMAIFKLIFLLQSEHWTSKSNKDSNNFCCLTSREPAGPILN